MPTFNVGDLVKYVGVDRANLPRGTMCYVKSAYGTGKTEMLVVHDQVGERRNLYAFRFEKSTLDKPEDFEYDV